MASVWFSNSAGRLKLEGDFACMVADSTDSPHACQGGTFWPYGIAVGPPTMIGGVNSPCGTRVRELVNHGRLGYRCTGLVGEHPVSKQPNRGPPPVGPNGEVLIKPEHKKLVTRSQKQGLDSGEKKPVQGIIGRRR